jgi:hypothetical protein
MMKEVRCEQSERFSEQDKRNHVIMMIAELTMTLCFFFSFRRINHMVLKTICIDPLSTRQCTSRRNRYEVCSYVGRHVGMYIGCTVCSHVGMYIGCM